MLIKYIIPALLVSAPMLASASQSLQTLPADIDMGTAEVSRGYLDAQLGSEFMRELLDGDDKRFSHHGYTGAGISWHNVRYLSLPKSYRNENYFFYHESMRPDPFWNDYRKKPTAMELELQTQIPGFKPQTYEEVSYSGFYIRKPNPRRINRAGGTVPLKSEDSGMNVVGMLVNIQYGPDKFPRPIKTLNELKYMNANMIFAAWAFNNKELLPD